MMAWSAPAHALPASLLVPICGGGFHPIDLPGRDPGHGPDCDKACHALCGRKSQSAKTR